MNCLLLCVCLMFEGCSQNATTPSAGPAQHRYLWTASAGATQPDFLKEPGYRLDNKTWPHGGNAKGTPHGAVFGLLE